MSNGPPAECSSGNASQPCSHTNGHCSNGIASQFGTRINSLEQQFKNMMFGGGGGSSGINNNRSRTPNRRPAPTGNAAQPAAANACSLQPGRPGGKHPSIAIPTLPLNNLQANPNTDAQGCSTSPLPRRPVPQMTLQFGAGNGRDSSVGLGTPRRRPKPEWKTETPVHNDASKNGDSAKMNDEIEKIIRKTGILTYHVNGKLVTETVTPADLEELCLLGKGTCGHVYKMRSRKSGKEMAVKQLRRTGNSEEKKRAIMDVNVVLESYDCPHIVQCYGCMITDCDLWICMELMATCLEKFYKHTIKQPIPEHILGKMTVSIIEALAFLKNERKIIHRDVKPSNILLDWDGTVKLCDFGISGHLVESKALTRAAGCMAYMAPERIDPKCEGYDIRADVWSLGITLVELALGHYPYTLPEAGDFAMATTILNKPAPSLPADSFSPEFCHFVSKCLEKDYTLRPKYEQLLQSAFIEHYVSEQVDVGGWLQLMWRRSSVDTQ